MRSWIGAVIAFAGLALLVTGCATSQDWTEWKSHSTHFASGDHAMFSLRNVGDKPEVRRSDLVAARAQNWWGKIVMVDQGQIFQN